MENLGLCGQEILFWVRYADYILLMNPEVPPPNNSHVNATLAVSVSPAEATSSCTEPEVHLAGASSGVYALIAAHLANVISNWSLVASSSRTSPSLFACCKIKSALTVIAHRSCHWSLVLDPV